MADEQIRIPVEIDYDRGLAQAAKFSRDANRQLAKIAPGAPENGRVKITADTSGAASAINNLANTTALANNQLSKLPQTSNQATNALGNLSRVAQDAPYGFIGIANNLNPLLESFQRLKVSTGSTGGALKALGSSLAGAGGLGLALGIGSSLLVLFGDKIFGAGKKAKEAAKEVDEAYKAAANSVAQQAVKLTSLVGIVQNVNAKYADKQKALAAINQEYGNYIKNLDLEKVTLNNVADAYDKIIDAMLRQAVVKGLQDEISKKVEETAKQIIKIEVAEQKRVAAVDKATVAQKQQLSQAEKVRIEQQGFNKAVNDGYIAQQRNEQATMTSMKALDNYDAVLKRTKDRLKEELAPLLNLTKSFDDLNLSLDKTKKAKDSFNDIISKAKEIANYLKDSFFKIEYEFDPRDDKATAFKKAQNFLNDVAAGNLKIKKNIFDFGFTEPPASLLEQTVTDPIADAISKGIFAGLNGPIPVSSLSTKMIQDISKKYSALFAEIGAKMPDVDFELSPVTNEENLQRELDKAKLEVPVYLNPSIKQGTSFADALKQSLKSLNEQFVQIVADFKNGIANAFANGVGDAVSGGGFESLFAGITTAVGGAMQSLGTAMIAYGIGLQKLKLALKPPFNPALALAGGIALVALGAIVKSRAAKSTPFASGGLVFSRTLGEIGEGTGTNSSNPEVVSPLDKLKGFFAGMINDIAKRGAAIGAGVGTGGGSFTAPQFVELYASGNALKGVLALTEQKQNRSF